MLVIVLSAFLLGAVAYDLISHRLPNFYLLLGLLAGLAIQVWVVGWSGLQIGVEGFLVGFAVLIPIYALGGMAAGDVKLMAVVGAFLDGGSALWASAYSLMAGGVLGVVYLICKGQFFGFFGRYWAMPSLRNYIPAKGGDAARHRFPYALAIAIGTLASLYWTPI
jgi:prepilin peptidase CpaA